MNCMCFMLQYVTSTTKSKITNYVQFRHYYYYFVILCCCLFTPPILFMFHFISRNVLVFAIPSSALCKVTYRLTFWDLFLKSKHVLRLQTCTSTIYHKCTSTNITLQPTIYSMQWNFKDKNIMIVGVDIQQGIIYNKAK